MYLLKKYDEFINEANTFVSMTLDIFKKKFNNKTSNFSLKNTQLYRAVTSNDEIIFQPKYSNSRKSRTGSNILVLLLSNLPSWKNFPKRAKAITCSTSLSYANEFISNFGNDNIYINNIYVCIPCNNCLIAIVPKHDLNLIDTSCNSCNELEILIGFIEYIPHFYIKFIETLKSQNEVIEYSSFLNIRDFTDWNSLKKSLQVFNIISKKYNQNKQIKTIIYENNSEKLFNDFFKNGNHDFLKWLDMKIEPFKNNFELKKYSKNFTINKKSNNGNEVWLDDDCYLIRKDIFEKLNKENFFN